MGQKVSVAQMVQALQRLPQDAEVWTYQENDGSATAASLPAMTPTGEVLIAWNGEDYNEGGL